MDRRTFLRLFGAATAAVGVSAATPQVLQKVVELAQAEGTVTDLEMVNLLARKHIVPGLVDNVFKQSPVLEYMKRGGSRGA